MKWIRPFSVAASVLVIMGVGSSLRSLSFGMCEFGVL